MTGRPVRELPADHLPALLDAADAGWFEIIGKDPATRSVRFRLTPLGEEVVGAFRAGRLAVLDPGPQDAKAGG